MKVFVNGVNSFARQALMSYKALFGWADIESYVFVKMFYPITQLVFFCLLSKYVYNAKDITPWVIGNSFLICTMNAFYGIGYFFENDRSFGTLQIIMVSPLNKIILFLGRTFIHIIDAVFSVIVGLTVGYFLFDVSFQNINISVFMLAIFAGVFATSGMGFLVGSLGLVTRDLNFVVNTLGMVFLALTGANIPVNDLPFILQRISYILPLTRTIQAGKLILTNNLGTVYSLLVQELLIGILYYLLGYMLFTLMEYMARKNATLDIY